MINFIEKDVLNIIVNMIDKIIYMDENLIPSIQAFSLVFLPRIIDDIRIDIEGINNFIMVVGKLK